MNICAASLQNLGVPADFYSPRSLWGTILADPVFDGVRHSGIKNRACMATAFLFG